MRALSSTPAGVTCCLIALLMLTAFGCTGPTQVISTDLTRQSGVYVVGFVDREDIRIKVEDRFAADLGERGIRAVSSRTDFGRIKQTSTRDLVRAANSHQVVAILIINRVAPDGSDSIIDSEQRIRPDDPDLQAYLAETRQEADAYADNEPVFAEANAFFVDGNKTRRFWTGTSWALEEDENQVIETISATIAEELARAAAELRDYGRPIQ